ncbi:CCA tRNA nucleotidyltransferase [Ureibacillus composti]|nr:CCA tRNA nucleotidyltransferase [Ureibacillus composti]
MRIPEFQSAYRVIDRIEHAGYEAVIVGGAVRDFLLQRKVNDVDVATNAQPLEVKQIFSSTIDVGIEHGTVLVLDEGEPIEVTTYRTDGDYVDHRRPDQVHFVRSLDEDLKRRDFTINALSMTKDGNIIDLFNGQTDLQNKVLRAVGEPIQRFEEDALRMLRAVRFSAQLGFSIEEKTMKAIQLKSQNIELIAKERIHMELVKLWKAPNVYHGITMLVESGLSQFLVGHFEVHKEEWKKFQANNSYVGWAYLCLLNNWDLHYISNFYKLSNKEKNFIQQVEQAYSALCNGGWTRFNLFLHELEVLEVAYDFALWQHKTVSYPKSQIAKLKSDLPIQTVKELNLNGHLLMSWSSEKRGPWIKEALDAALIAVINGQVENNVDQLKEWFMYEFNNER